MGRGVTGGVQDGDLLRAPALLPFWGAPPLDKKNTHTQIIYTQKDILTFWHSDTHTLNTVLPILKIAIRRKGPHYFCYAPESGLPKIKLEELRYDHNLNRWKCLQVQSLRVEVREHCEVINKLKAEKLSLENDVVSLNETIDKLHHAVEILQRKKEVCIYF